MKKAFDRASQSNLILIWGQEDELRRETLRELLVHLETGPDDFDFDAIGATDKSIGDWISSVSTIPFFAERRTLVVRNLLRIDPKEVTVNKILTQVPSSGRLILVADEESGGEDRAQRLATMAKQWSAAVTQAGGVCFDCTIDPKSFQAELSQEAKKREKRMSGPALNLLQEMTGGHYSRAVAELEKLCLFVGDSPEIREADVSQVVLASHEWSIWVLVDAVAKGNTAAALRQLRIILSSRNKLEEAALRSVLPQLTRHIRLLWQARACLDVGERPPNLSTTCLKMLPEKNISHEKQFVVNKLLQQAQGVTLWQCSRCLEELAIADGRLKGQLPAGSTLDTLEIMVLNLSNTLRAG